MQRGRVNPVEKINTPPLTLGEGPVWHQAMGWLLFVDIKGCTVYGYDPQAKHLQAFPVEEAVGFVVPYGPRSVAAGIGNTLTELDLSTGRRQALARLEMPEGMRFNDGKCDAQGRLWVGGMMDADEARDPGSGCLYGMEGQRVIQRLPGMTIPNGMDWTADGHVYYHTDTLTRRIDAYAMGPSGTLSGRRTAVDLGQETGLPDGFCIDQEGMLWVAMWGGHQVLRCDPASGCVLTRLSVPQCNVSSCAFGGEGLCTLYVTTAADDAGQAPGALYAYPMDVKGTLPNPYRL